MVYTKFWAIASVVVVLFACGGDNSSNSVQYEQNGSVYEVLDVVSIKDKSISGVSQKGPFVTGSVVKLYELDGETCAQTGKSFTGKIASDDGKFSVSRVTLASQYALLEANGYFRNEVTGEKSNSTITLNALTDLSEREKVNINLLTHLEYERALYLVGTGFNVPSAKKQAEAEILNAFGIQGNFANSEDLDIFEKGEGNAALLAFSVLLLRDLSEADLTELLTKFAIDIEKDGSWDDASIKAKIADWVQSKDLAGLLATIHRNIEKWNLGMVPEFERYVRNFWYMNYGLGGCDKDREGEVLATSNELSATYGTQIRFICKSGTWIEASNIEKDLYKSEKNNGGEDGEIWTGPVSGEKYKYDEALGKWVPAIHNDTTLKLMGCTVNRTGEIGKSPADKVYYMCVDSDWLAAREIDYDTYGETCASADVGKTVVGVVTKTNRYYCTANGWVSLMDWNWNVPKDVYLNTEIDYGTMTDSRDNKEYKTVKIGDQIWMAENLNYADSVKTASLLKNSWCYDDVAKNCDVAGRLYTWAAAIDSVKLANDVDNPLNCGYGKTCTLPDTVYGICPPGWHLPSRAEWDALLTAVGVVGLKSQNGWFSYNSDAFGFSAMPVGIMTEVHFTLDGCYAVFWSSSEYDVYGAYSENLWYSPCYVSLPSYEINKNYAYSVRCVENAK